MIPVLELQQRIPVEDPVGPQSHIDDCQLQLASAQRELEAFTLAVKELYGSVAALSAAHYWLEMMDSVDRPAFTDWRRWRLITIQAANRLAMEQD